MRVGIRWLRYAALLRAGRGQHGGRRRQAGRQRPASPGRRGAAAAQWARPFPPCCGEQSLCGAGPGLGLDRTVPGTMVSTGPRGTPAAGGGSARRSAPAARLRPPGWSPIGAGPGPAAAAPAWQWLPFAPGPPRGVVRGGSTGPQRGPARPRYRPRCRPRPWRAGPLWRWAGSGLGRRLGAAGAGVTEPPVPRGGRLEGRRGGWRGCLTAGPPSCSGAALRKGWRVLPGCGLSSGGCGRGRPRGGTRQRSNWPWGSDWK